MTLCPIALASGCRKCAIFSLCPLKGVIGDYRKQEDAPPRRDADQAGRSGKPQ
jgi:hypothetical protein